MTVAIVHGFPETSAIWRPLQGCLDGDSVAIALPGLGAPRPAGFTATKDAYASWLGEALAHIDPPLDLVGHDIGALLTLRLASAFDLPLRSFVVDVANVFHPGFVWPDRVRSLQTPVVGEELLQAARVARRERPKKHHRPTRRKWRARRPGGRDRSGPGTRRRASASSTSTALPCQTSPPTGGTTPGPTRARGLVLLLPDPPEDEAMSLDVASRLAADTERLENHNHCWMAEAPDQIAAVLQRFWSSLER